MIEMWLNNPHTVRTRSASSRGPEHRPRVRIARGTRTFTLGKRSPYKGRVLRVNQGGALMIANRPRRRHRRRGSMPPALARYWAGRRRHRRNLPNVPNPPRHARRSRRAVRRSTGRGGALFSLTRWQTYGMTAFGMVAPSLVTDRVLPMLGIALTGWLRRGVQFAVPAGVQWFAPHVLGRDTGAFLAGAYAVTLLGAVNDLTGGMPGMVGGYVRTPAGMSGYAPVPRRAANLAAAAS